MEEWVFFGEKGMRLEGLYAAGAAKRGAVVCHPHSLMGGDMHNPVVETLAQALFGAGFSTLRFNFRGVGASAGIFDEGRGERDDLQAAKAFLEARGVREVLPAGYSFGAWVIAGAAAGHETVPALFVAPPVVLFPFDLKSLKGRVGLIVCGDRDPYCPAEEARRMAAEVSCPLALLPGADHFFSQGLADLAERVGAFAAAQTFSADKGPQ